jgi:SP family sugar porter-like MFS transporter
MGGLLFGYDWVVVGGAKPFYEPYFHITDDTPFLRGWAQSSALVGCIVGAILSGMLSDRFGRKRLLIGAGFLFTVSAVWTAFSQTLTDYSLARILGGLGIGLASNLSPMYIAEISPAAVRGRFVSINQLTIVIGVLAAQCVNWMLAHSHPLPAEAGAADILAGWHGQSGWRWMFGAETVPAFLFFVLMFLLPESPRWLVKYGRTPQAQSVLSKVGGPEYAGRELKSIQSTLAEEEIAAVHYRELFEPKLMKIVLLGIFLAVFQQWCGINSIFNYAQEIFSAAGYTVGELLFNIVITGTVNLLFTFAAIFTVDRLGRKALMLLGSAGLAGIYAVLGTGYYFQVRGVFMLVLVLAAIAFYAMSLAPITWVIISEIFPNRIRGAAMAAAVLSLWIACTVLTSAFPYLNRSLGPHGTFWLYGAICLGGFFVILYFLPETKGKSLEQIEQELVSGRCAR